MKQQTIVLMDKTSIFWKDKYSYMRTLGPLIVYYQFDETDIEVWKAL